MRILLVEDDKALAEATAQLLRTEGYVVDWVAALDDATSAVRSPTHWYCWIWVCPTATALSGYARGAPRP